MALLGRDTSVEGPFPAGVLLLESLRGEEALGKPYRFEIGLLSHSPDLDPDAILGQPLTVTITLNNNGKRFFHGLVVSFAKIGHSQRHTRYHATLRPLFGRLGDTCDCRVFNEQGQSAQSIIDKVLEKAGAKPNWDAILGHVYRDREYCVQYRESDMHFVQRLLEEEGLHYFFRHDSGKHTMVVADASGGHDKAPGYEAVLCFPKERTVHDAEEHLWGMRVRNAVYPGRVTVLADYDPTNLRPSQLQLGEQPSGEAWAEPIHEAYDYPSGLSDLETAQEEATVRMQTACAENTVIEVEGNTMGLGVGHLVSLRKSLETEGNYFPFWREDQFSAEYLVVGATYSLVIDQHESGEHTLGDEPFHARYQLLDSQRPVRTRRTTRKPVMPGPQTALVVGSPGEEIDTDELGRVKVQFDWDRLGEKNRDSSCWVRVAQTWAGAKWGSIHIPRIGQEVIVEFFDGDPDRPLVTGRLYNADNMPPYDLPANKTQSGIKSRSSKGGTAANFNEIRFEDKRGEEELHIQAEKDMSTLVKNNQTLEVAVDRSLDVGHDEDTHIKHNRTTKVGADDQVLVEGSHHKEVKGAVTQIYCNGDKGSPTHVREVHGDQTFEALKNKTEHVVQAYTLTTDQKFELHQSATSLTFEDTNVTLDCAGMITLTAGKATVKVAKDGTISLDSPIGIKLTCAGSGIVITAAGIVVTAAEVSAGAGPSQMKMGKDEVLMKSKQVTIEAENTCSIQGKRVLKLNTP